MAPPTKRFRKERWFEEPSRSAFINITGEVRRCVDLRGVREGLVLVCTKAIWFFGTAII